MNNRAFLYHADIRHIVTLMALRHYYPGYSGTAKVASAGS